jgi:hypothetical protein
MDRRIDVEGIATSATRSGSETTIRWAAVGK